MDLQLAVKVAVVANAVVLLGISVYVIALYGAVYSATKERDTRQLPLHIWLVATSLLGYVAGSTYFLLVDPSYYEWPRLAVYGISGLLANYGLSNVLRYERRKLIHATGYMDREHGQGANE